MNHKIGNTRDNGKTICSSHEIIPTISKIILIYLPFMKNTTDILFPRLLHIHSSCKNQNTRTLHYSENVILDIIQANYRKVDSFVTSSS